MGQLPTRIDGPVSVIGDVHGQIDQLETVLGRLKQRRDWESRWLVFIGDLVDRGPDSRAVMDIVCELLETHPRTTVVCGNHELAMAGALGLIPVPEYAGWGERWVRDYLSEPTFASYDVPHGDLAGLLDALSEPHRALLADAPWCVEHPEFLFVHAGLDANQPYPIQLRIMRQRDFTLNRPPWLCSKSFVTAPTPHDCPLTVVSGHVRVDRVRLEPKRILIDTTGGEGGDLSCVLLPERVVITSGSASPSPASAHSSSPQRAHGSRPSASSAPREERRWWKFW